MSQPPNNDRHTFYNKILQFLIDELEDDTDEQIFKMIIEQEQEQKRKHKRKVAKRNRKVATNGIVASSSAQGETDQVPSSVQPQQGYMGQPSSNPAYPTQPAYGVPPTTQPGYGAQSAAQGGYWQPQWHQRTPPLNLPAYGLPQQSPQGGYALYCWPAWIPPCTTPSCQPVYCYAAGYHPAAATYGAANQPGAYYPPPYGVVPFTPPCYGQQPAAFYGNAYNQPAAYPADVEGAAAESTSSSGPQAVAQTNGAATTP